MTTDIIQMKLNKFCETYGYPRTTILRWIEERNFPAIKIFGRWYVDIQKYNKWKSIILRK